MSGSSNGSADWLQKNGSGGDSAQQSEAREPDCNLPIANVSRIMKKGLPDHFKISKEAKDMVQECVSEFIAFITNEASHRCMTDKRKTVNGDDLLTALSALGFDDYVNPLKLYLAKYREFESGMKGTSSTPEQNLPLDDQVTASTPELPLDDQVNGQDIYFPFIQDHK